MSTQGGSTLSLSSSLTPRWKHDVFLSFKGEDTRNSFTDHLYTALKQKGILTFKYDEKIERGKAISREILEAIEESRFSIVILSKNYASSIWCLDELVQIIRCSKERGVTVLPVFYDVDPSDVRRQRGTFSIPFAVYMEKIEMWRAALTEVANLSGWLVQDGHVSELIQSIVELISQNLSSSFSSITNDLVGIDSLVEELITSYLDLGNNVCMIGVCGMGGSGKTTLARVVYGKFRGYFEGSSFIANVREYSKKIDLLQLQQLLLADILEERNIDIRNVYHGVDMIKRRLCHKKVLIVLDDVNKLDQLENLAGECGWFGLKSLIIITTRDEHLLVQHGVHKIYKPNALSSDDSLKLFCLKAFKNEQPKEGYMQLSQDVVHYANGHPLALVTFGSFLFGRTMDVWQSALDRFKKIPKREIFDTLKVSYDGLEEMWKDIFLDVACFFRGKMKDQVIEILETCGFDARIGIQVLMDKSLLTLENGALQMHDLLQEMGMEIVRQESREEPGKRSRLWLRKDLFHVLMNNTATKAIQAIVLEFGGDGAYRHIESYSEVFSRMCNLRLLIIDNVHIPNGLNHLSNELRLLEWHGYSSKCLPSRFQSKELVELKLQFSKIEYLWRGEKYLDKLKFIDLEHSINLMRTPDFSGVPRLEKLCLRGCINLVEIHPSIGQLSKLTVLNLEFCQSLINLPSSMDGLRSLEVLILLGCSKLAKLPENLGKIECLKELDLTGAAIREVPSSISFLICCGCEKQFFKSRLDSVFSVRLLKYLALSTNNLVFALPASISQLPKLEALNLGNCIQLHSLPDLPSNVRYINAKGCSSLEASPALLSMSNLSQPSISFFNCCKLVEYKEGSDGLAFAMLKRYLQGLIYPKTGLYETSTKRKDRSKAAFQIIIPGLDVPQWLTHQRIGYSISIELPPNWCNSRWMGFALCALFRINCYGYSSESYSLKGHVKALGDLPQHTFKVIGETSFEVVIGETSFDYSVGHLWLLYWSRDDLLGTHWNGHECSQINVVFDSNSPSAEVIKCAVRLIYEQDVAEFNQTTAQCSTSCVITSEGLDCVHHEFENSAVEKATKIIRTYDDNNRAEHSASWSFHEETVRVAKTKDGKKEIKGEQFRWSKPMQCLLLEILANDATKGNKPSNTFMPRSLARAAQEISGKFGVECQLNHVENCLRTIESIWSTITKLRNRKKNFGWNDNLKMITCEKKVYDEEVMAHPDHEQYLNKKIEMYDKMALIFCKDNATWGSAKSFSGIESEKRILELESNALDIDFEKASKGKQVSSSNAALSGASSLRKRSRMNQDANYGKFSKQLRKVELAIKKLKKDQLDVNELYEEVMKIERFNEVMLAFAFDYLVDNERVAKAFMAKNARLRTLWLESFFNQNGIYGN
ncbi:TMV resistance protein N-like isoform X2 [Quercus robur]|uniref:TMV resistance protein N-like isoform X2 n=1 Tax=Quercus robur TaxID=38942 RepID=UPI002161EA01|nr:TMV resistance protein N-like isoform X2 [Quercus robur]